MIKEGVLVVPETKRPQEKDGNLPNGKCRTKTSGNGCASLRDNSGLIH
jgi:hypothetical protein